MLLGGTVRGPWFETCRSVPQPFRMTQGSRCRFFKTSSAIIRWATMMYVRYLPSLRNHEDLLHGRGIEISHETVRIP